MSAKGSMVEHVMEREVVTCFPTATVKEVSELMKTRGSTYCCVVEPESGQIVGILTETDLVPQLRSFPRTRGQVPAYHFFGKYFSLETVISKIYQEVADVMVEQGMTKKVITVMASKSVGDALKCMAKNRLRRIPVIDGNERLVGIVTSQALSSALFE